MENADSAVGPERWALARLKETHLDDIEIMNHDVSKSHCKFRD
jgi:hypothetical protein